MEEKRENKTIIEKIFEKAKEIGTREFSGFSVSFNDNLDLVFTSTSGWSVTYPMGTETWALLANWIEIWDEPSKMTVENFIKVVVFPASVRLSDIDIEYISDIIKAHENLTARSGKAGKYDLDDEEDKTLGEAISNVFGDEEQGSDSD